MIYIFSHFSISIKLQNIVENEGKEHKNVFFKEYNIKNEKENYILKVEIEEKKYINFILKRFTSLDYIYNNSTKIGTLNEKLQLNLNHYSNLEIIDKFDIMVKKEKIKVNINNDNKISLIFNKSKLLKSIKYELDLNENYMNMNDKINLLYNEINSLKYGKNKENSIDMNKSENEINHINEKINYLDLKINKKEDDIKNIINENAEIVEKLNNQLNKLFENLIQYKEYMEKSIINDIMNQLNYFKLFQDNSNSEFNAIKSYIKMPLLKYYHKHGFSFENSSESCIACHQKIGGFGSKGSAYICQQCKIFFCYNCGKYILNGKQEKQIHSHILAITFRISWICNLCFARYQNTPSFYCKICDFDACMNCYVNSLSKNNNFYLFK